MKSETGLRYVRPATGSFEAPATLAGGGFSPAECRFFQQGEELEAAAAAGLSMGDLPALQSPPRRSRLPGGRLSSMILAGLLLLGGLVLTTARSQGSEPESTTSASR
jgi:hypothetical protein